MNIGFLYAVGAALTWGLVYTIDQKILTNVSPIALLFINSIVTAVIVLPLVFFNRDGVKTLLGSGQQNLALILLSLLLATLANFLIFSAIKHIGASSASVIEIAYPFFVVLFSIILFKITPSVWFFLGGILIFIGSALITYSH